MNQQLQIITDPATGNKTIESPILKRRFDSAMSVITVSTAIAYVYVNDGSLLYTATLPTTITNTDQELSITWDTDSQNIIAEKPLSNYKIVWVVNGENVTRFYDAVIWKMENPISEYDILIERPELDRYRPVQNLEISSVTSGVKFVCRELIEPIHFWEGSIMRMQSPVNRGQQRRIIDWDFDTQTLTVDKAFEFTPVQGDVFTMRRGFYPELYSAWVELLHTLHSWVPKFYSNTNQPLAPDSFDFRQIHLYATIEKIYSTPRVEAKDEFDLGMKLYAEKKGQALNELRAKVDRNLSGLIGGFNRTGTIWQSR